MKKCPECNKRYEDSQKFCSDCGIELVELSQEEQALVAEESQKAQSKKKGVIAIACVLVLAIIFVFGVALLPTINNKAMAKAAISAVEDEIGRTIVTDYCYKFDIPQGNYNQLGYSIAGTYIEVSYLNDSYFVKMDGKTVTEIIYDDDFTYLDLLYENPKYYDYYDITMYYLELLIDEYDKLIKIEL